MTRDGDDGPADPEWYAMSAESVAERVGASTAGLSEEMAVSRLEEHGPNRLPRARPPPWWRIGLRQFQNPLIYVLAVAATVAAAIGEFIDAGFISGQGEYPEA